MWMSNDGQGTKCRRNIADNFNRLRRVHARYRRQTTDGRATANSEKFTFAINVTNLHQESRPYRTSNKQQIQS